MMMVGKCLSYNLQAILTKNICMVYHQPLWSQEGSDMGSFWYKVATKKYPIPLSKLPIIGPLSFSYI